LATHWTRHRGPIWARALIAVVFVGIPALVAGMRAPAPQRILAGNGLDLGSSHAYVSFGADPALGLPEFTIEAWFRRDGSGSNTRTGTGGTETAVPLVTKGRSEHDGDERDMNWFLGIEAEGDVLCADFEEGSTGAHPGLNHIVFGTTPITNGTWVDAPGRHLVHWNPGADVAAGLYFVRLRAGDLERTQRLLIVR